MSYYGGYTSTTVSNTGPCPGCNVSLPLYGSHWTEGFTVAQFVILCLCLGAVVLLALGQCVFGARKSSAVIDGRWLYLAALIVTIIYFALEVMSISLYETFSVVKYSYYVIYVFFTFFYQAGIILTILALSAVALMPRIAKVAIAVLLSLLCALCVAIQIRYAVLTVNQPAYEEVDDGYITGNDFDFFDLLTRWSYINLIVDLVFNLVCLLVIFGIGPVLLRSARNLPRNVVTMAIVSLAALGIQEIFQIASDAIFISYQNPNNIDFEVTDQAINFAEISPELEYAFLTISLILLFLVYLMGSRAAKSGAYHPETSQYPQQYPPTQSTGEYQHAAGTTAP